MSNKEPGNARKWREASESAMRCGLYVFGIAATILTLSILWHIPDMHRDTQLFQFESHDANQSQSSNKPHVFAEINTIFDATQLFTAFDLNMTDFVGSTQSTQQIFAESRAVTGNIQHFWRFFNQIFVKKQCVTTLVIGGSVSAPKGDPLIAHLRDHRWWQLFNVWLNEMYPCVDGAGKHQIINKAVGATNSDYILQNFYSTFMDNAKYDLIFIEFAINDHGWPKPRPRGSSSDVPLSMLMEYDAMKRSERLIRNILSLYSIYFDYCPLIMYIDIGYDRGRRINMINPYFKAATFAHQQIAFYYQLPMISWNHVMLPYDVYTYCIQDTRNCRQNPKWFFDMHHPNDNGHKLAAILIAYNFGKELSDGYKQILEYKNQGKKDIALPAPWILTQNETQHYSLQKILKSPINVMDFTKERSYDPLTKKYIVYNRGWSQYPETEKKKYGLIATTANSLIIFKVNATKRVQLDFLKTYENIGAVAIWVNEFREEMNMTSSNQSWNCDEYYNRNKNRLKCMNGYHNDKTSVHNSRDIMINNGNTLNKKHEYYLHICLLSEREHGMKFKLLQIQTF